MNPELELMRWDLWLNQWCNLFKARTGGWWRLDEGGNEQPLAVSAFPLKVVSIPGKAQLQLRPFVGIDSGKAHLLERLLVARAVHSDNALTDRVPDLHKIFAGNRVFVSLTQVVAHTRPVVFEQIVDAARILGRTGNSSIVQLDRLAVLVSSE